MSTRGSGVFCHAPTRQADETTIVAPPTSGQIYDWVSGNGIANMAAATIQRNVRIMNLAARSSWTVQPTPLQVHVVIDGNTFTCAAANPVSATWYYIRPFGSTVQDQLLLYDADRFPGPWLWEGKQIQLGFEITGGTLTNLEWRVKWATWRVGA